MPRPPNAANIWPELDQLFQVWLNLAQNMANFGQTLSFLLPNLAGIDLLHDKGRRLDTRSSKSEP